MPTAKRRTSNLRKRPEAMNPEERNTFQEIDFESIFTQTALYTQFEDKVNYIEDGQHRTSRYSSIIRNYYERIEMYCTNCATKRVFAPDIETPQSQNMRNLHHGGVTIDKCFFKIFRCSSNPSHQLVYGFFVDKDDNFTKVSEFPSKYDTVKGTLAKYTKVLIKDKVTELGKAAQLESFGYTIASFLYYRRIFEHIIFTTFENAEIQNKKTNDEFRYLRMNEKVQYLKDYLPEYLQENSSMYSVLSKGIHELEEKECQEYLPIVKTILFFSLDEAVDKRNKERRKEELAKQLGNITNRLNSNG